MENGKKNSDDIPHHNTATANKGNNNSRSTVLFINNIDSRAKQSKAANRSNTNCKRIFKVTVPSLRLLQTTNHGSHLVR